jgi:hypothetical protein
MSDSYWVDPTLSEYRSVTLKGADVVSYTNAIRVFETVCKPYITGQLTLVDNNYVIENLDIKGGEEITGSFRAPPNDKTYDFKAKVLTIKGTPNPANLKTIIYTIDFIGHLYYADRGNMVQQAFQGQTATGAAQTIFNKFLGTDKLNIPVGSIGMLGDKNAYTVNNKKPITAITDIMKTMLFGQYKTGNVLFYRDAEQVNIVPLEHLFNTLSSQEKYIQKETWGTELDPLDIYRAIIFAAADNSRSGAGRGAAAEISATAGLKKGVFNQFDGSFKWVSNVTDALGSFGKGNNPITSSFVQSAVGGIGGSPIIQLNDSNRWPDATAPHNKTINEKIYSAQARGGPQIQFKVPLQSGINSTVGKGVTLYLMPPGGDFPKSEDAYSTGGLYLVTDLAHELVTGDNNEIIGTTTMQAIRGGYQG